MKKKYSDTYLQEIDSKKIRLGVCAMRKKIDSKHMQNILDEIKKFDEFEIIIFVEEKILNEDVENWPIVDALIIFFSTGFPFSKGLKYVNLRKPFLINDFESQKIFWDRRKVLDMLKEENIPTPKCIIIDRGEEINNDVGINNNLNNSDDIENLINLCKNQGNKSSTSLSSFSLGSSQNLSILKKDSDNKLSFENKEKEQKKEKNSFYIEHNSIITNKYFNNNNNNNENNNIENNNIENNNNIEETELNPIEKELKEFDDHIEYKGKKLFKPFVEKPFNGDDHYVYIYYPPSHGGGIKILFRKTKDYCACFINGEYKIRRDKSYIYEEFLQAGGFDIKVYTIGEEYAHAEARKSPSLDGKVQRTIDGKEVRYPINLKPEEKEMARKIVKKFKQNICGFDILRANGQSYVCDVNGWSFVKGKKKYYEDCAILLRKIILQQLDLKLYLSKPIHIKKIQGYKNLQIPYESSTNNEKPEELRSVVAIFRHADRSPKQKMKLVVEDKTILSLFDKFGKKEEKNFIEENVNIENITNNNNSETKKIKYPYIKEIKLKKPEELMCVLKIVTKILDEHKNDKSNLLDVNENLYSKLFQVKMVLEKNLNFEGMTRKIQMKPLCLDYKLDPDTHKKIFYVKKALFILKWGGNLTHAGIEQAKLLGITFRVQMYPSSAGNGLLRLHNTYRHDLKCYSSDEGRCLKTAASFLQGMLQLDGEPIPIISSMVMKDPNITKALDVNGDQVPEVKGKIKQEISECLNYNGKLIEKFKMLFKINSIYPDAKNDEEINEKNKIQFPLYDLLNKIGNPYDKMKRILVYMNNFIEHIKSFLSKEEIEHETQSYYIKSSNSIQKRDSFQMNFTENDNNNENMNFILNYDDEDISSINKQHSFIESSSKDMGDIADIISKKKLNSSNSDKNLLNEEKANLSQNDSSKSSFNPLTNRLAHDCEDEKVILIYKRYIKLKQDFFNKKKNNFDVSKIPDLYDNIKYDITHNKIILNQDAYKLYELIDQLANFTMPLEYGITLEEKLDIGTKIIGPILSKIYRDLIWWNYNNPYFPKNNNNDENSFSGLDQSSLELNEIKSAWRHVKSRIYFTCASHMYSLLNLLMYGNNSSLIENKEVLEQLRGIFDIDYVSHVIFRLFENFNVDISDNKRFRLEIIISPGSTKDPREADKDHLINISPWIMLNSHLTLQQMKEFFLKYVKEEN